jgi:hypothetical protein
VNSDSDGSDGNVSGDVSPYTPAVGNPPGRTPAVGDADKLNVTILNPDVEIVGVVVKGGGPGPTSTPRTW